MSTPVARCSIEPHVDQFPNALTVTDRGAKLTTCVPHAFGVFPTLLTERVDLPIAQKAGILSTVQPAVFPSGRCVKCLGLCPINGKLETCPSKA